MAIDFSKPALTDNYTSAFVPNLQANQTALARMLDSGVESITGTIPTNAKRYNRSSSAFEEWNGSAWVVMPLQGINFASGNIGLGVAPAFKLDVLATAASVANFKSSASSAIIRIADGTADTGYVGSGSGLLAGLARTDFGITANAGGALVLGANNVEMLRITSAGQVDLGTSGRPLIGIGNLGGYSDSGAYSIYGGRTTLNGGYAQFYAGSHASAPNTVILGTAGVERVRVDAAGNVLIARTSSSGLGPLQISDSAGALGDFASSFAGTALLRVRNAGAQVVGIAVQNGATGTGGSDGLRVLVDAAGAAYVSQEEALPLYLQTSGLTRVTVDAAGLVTAAIGFAGPGSGLTALNASNLASGTVPNARTTASSGFGTNTIVSRDSNGDAAMRGLVLQNTAVAGNVLNWFEKDVSFTPVVQFGGGAATGWSFNAQGRYTRIGNCVFFHCSITVTAVGAATGNCALPISAFPYAPGIVAGLAQYAELRAENASGLGTGALKALMTSTQVALYTSASATGNMTNITNANMPNGSSWSLCGHYFV